MPFWTHLAHLWPGKRGLSILLHQAVLNWGISRVLAEGKEGFLLHQREGAGLKLKADFRERALQLGRPQLKPQSC